MRRAIEMVFVVILLIGLLYCVSHYGYRTVGNFELERVKRRLDSHQDQLTYLFEEIRKLQPTTLPENENR